MQDTDTLPVQPFGRMAVLDVFRGFFILGIYIANSAAFSGYVFQTLPKSKYGYSVMMIKKSSIFLLAQ